jgi:hypothetical protein
LSWPKPVGSSARKANGCTPQAASHACSTCSAEDRFRLLLDDTLAPAGNAIRQDPTGKSGTSVGTELDFILNFIKTATTPGGKDNASALYVQYSFKW